MLYSDVDNRFLGFEILQIKVLFSDVDYIHWYIIYFMTFKQVFNNRLTWW